MVNAFNLLPFLEQFLVPGKRLFLGYLVTALLIALAFLRVKHGSLAEAWRSLRRTHPLWTASTRADYGLAVLNFVLLNLIGSLLLTNIAVASLVFEWLGRLLDAKLLFYSAATPFWLPALYTLTLFMVDDFARFFLHYLMHRWPLLWAFHKVHHSADTLTPLTVLRTHPVEGVLFALRASLVQGVCIAVFVYLFGNQFSLILVLGSNVLVFLFNLLGANLRHSQVYLRYFPWLERWLISPAQHQIHHSLEPRHYDKNMGVVLAVWDRLFATLYISDNTAPTAIGVHKNAAKPHGYYSLLILPFKDCYRALRRSLKKVWLRVFYQA